MSADDIALGGNDANYGIYKALDADRKEIRLLVLRGATLETDQIQCTLLHVSLASTDLPSYETVSYVWGMLKCKSPRHLLFELSLSQARGLKHQIRR